MNINSKIENDANKKTLIVLIILISTMFGLAFASVPLYRLFCQVTGYGGTTNVVNEHSEAPKILNRMIKIRFNADTDEILPWTFKAPKEIEIKIGQETIIEYEATNNSDEIITGTATYNATPQKVGEYFVKQHCFCFEEQKLKPGQTAKLPVSFYIDPAIAEDSNMDDIKTITLSYTMFKMN